MGVDTSAFAVYGVRVTFPKGVDVYEVSLPPELHLYEWGSRRYGGVGGYILGISCTHTTIETGDGDGKEIAPLIDRGALWLGAELVLLESTCASIAFPGKADGPPSWFVASCFS